MRALDAESERFPSPLAVHGPDAREGGKPDWTPGPCSSDSRETGPADEEGHAVPSLGGRVLSEQRVEAYSGRQINLAERGRDVHGEEAADLGASAHGVSHEQVFAARPRACLGSAQRHALAHVERRCGHREEPEMELVDQIVLQQRPVEPQPRLDAATTAAPPAARANAPPAPSARA
jgi:hypothetical protein